MNKVYFKNSDQKPAWYRRPSVIIGGLMILGLATAIIQIWPTEPEDVIALVDTPSAQAQETEANKQKTETSGKQDQDKKSTPTSDKESDKGDIKQLSDEDKQAELDEREFQTNKLGEIQADILRDLTEIRDLQQKLDSRLEKRQMETNKEKSIYLAKLIKIISSMRAEDAAAVIPKLNESLAVKILSALKGSKSSKIMGNMPPEKAASIGAKMVEFKPEPDLQAVLTNWSDIVEKEEADDKAKRYPTQQ